MNQKRKFIDYFEFDNKISLPSFNYFIEVLNTIIGDNPIHFDIEFNPALSYFEYHSTTFIKDLQILIYAIRYKQVNFPTQSQTVWDLFISKLIAVTKDIRKQSNLDFSVDSSSKTNRYSGRKDEIGQMISSLNVMQDSIRGFIVDTNDSAQQVAASSQELTAMTEQSAIAIEDLSKTIICPSFSIHISKSILKYESFLLSVIAFSSILTFSNFPSVSIGLL